MSYSNEEIFSGVNGGRWQSCTAQMEYRKMLALESIAASLAKLANPAYVIESPAAVQQMAASIETNSAEHDEGVERQRVEGDLLIRRRRHKDGA